MKLAEFMETYRESLNEKVLEEFRPQYDFNPTEFLPGIREFKRRPFPSQIHPIAALAKALTNGHRSAFVAGEMGVGKTLIGIAAAKLCGFRKVLVLCPPHLVRKWKREIEQTLPRASASIVRSITELEKVIASLNPAIHFVIISRERAKLGYRRRPAYAMFLKGESMKYRLLCCPECGSEITDSEGVPLEREDLMKKKFKCAAKVKTRKGERECGAALWQADNKGPKRYPLAEYIKRRYRKFFDGLVIDEVHEAKAKGSAQGYAAASLASASKKVLALTGTLFGGYSTSLFHLLYRFSQSIKLEFKHSDDLRFASRYGILERVTQIPKDDFKEEGVTSKRRDFRTRIVERPGVSPAIITELLDKTVFLRLSDVSEALPSYQDLIEVCKMADEQKEIYETFSRKLKDALNDELRKGGKRLLGAYLQSLLAWPDQPWKRESIYKTDVERRILLAETVALSEDAIYPKEKRLIEICRENKATGRKVGVYVTHTERRDITGRLKKILEAEGLRVVVLKSDTVAPEKREDWIKGQVQSGMDVLVCHPKLCQTGLDLLDFPTLAFYQTEWSVYTLRQASRRSWRIGQRKSVRVHYMIYEDTIQERALALVAKKTKASLAVEGEFVDGGLSSFANEEDIVTELAKSFVKGKAAGETLEALFQASRESEAQDDRYLSEPTPGAESGPACEDHRDPGPRPEPSYVVVREDSGQLGFEFV